MMSDEQTFIKRTERVYLIIFGVFVSIINALNMLVIWIESIINPPLFEFSGFERDSLIPVGRVLSIFIFLFIVFAKRYVVSLSWTGLCIVPFLYDFAQAYKGMHYNVDVLYNTPALAVMRMIANPLDYLSFLLLIVLLVWLVGAVVRAFCFEPEVK